MNPFVRLATLAAVLVYTALPLPLMAQQAALGEYIPQPATGIRPVSDASLDHMRGRFITGAGQILYFGVEMLSTWRSSDGRVFSGSALLGFDFSKGAPQISFVPTVSLVQGSGGALVDTTGRSIDASGLANVGGIVQGIQITGDHNSAGNSTELHRTTAFPATPATGVAGNAAVSDGIASASVTLQPDRMAVTLDLAGQGSLRQLIRGDADGGGAVLQTVSLLGDSHAVSNQLRITLVQPVGGSAAQMLRQNVAQSLGLLQGLRGGR